MYKLVYHIGNQVEGRVMDCSICGSTIGKDISGWAGGHNSWPVNEGRCCGTCNDTKVLPARLINLGYTRKQATEMGNALMRADAITGEALGD